MDFGEAFVNRPINAHFHDPVVVDIDNWPIDRVATTH